MLWLLADAREPVPLRDIVETLDISKNAAHRLLAEFSRQSLVTKTPDHRYQIGPVMVALAGRILRDQPLRVAARPLLEEIGRHTSETVALHIRSGRERVCLDTVESPHPIRRVIPLGQALPLYLGPASKAMLAYLPEEEQNAILARAQAEGMDSAEIRRQLDDIVSRGYIAAIGDHIAGVGGLAFALRRDGNPVASIAISGPAERWSLPAMRNALPFLRERCAADLPGWTTTLGAAPPG